MHGKLIAFNSSEEQQSQIAAYMQKNYPALNDLKPRNRNGNKLTRRTYDDYANGINDGKDVELNRGVNAENIELLEE